MNMKLLLRNTIPPDLLDVIYSVNVNLNQSVVDLAEIKPKIDDVLEKFSNGSYSNSKDSAIIETSHILSTVRHKMNSVDSNMFVIQSSLSEIVSNTENLDKKIVSKILADKLSNIAMTANLIDSSSKMIMEKIVSITDQSLTSFHDGLRDLSKVLKRFDESLEHLLADLRVLKYDNILALERDIENSREVLINALVDTKSDIIHNLTYSLDFKFDNLKMPECDSLIQTLIPSLDSQKLADDIVSKLDFSNCQGNYSCVCPEPVLECSCPKNDFSCPDLACDCPGKENFIECQGEIHLECPSNNCSCLSKHDFLEHDFGCSDFNLSCPKVECPELVLSSENVSESVICNCSENLIVDRIIEKLSLILEGKSIPMIDETVLNLKNSTSSSLEMIFDDFGFMKLETFLMFCIIGLIFIMIILLCVMMVFHFKLKKMMISHFKLKKVFYCGVF